MPRPCRRPRKRRWPAKSTPAPRNWRRERDDQFVLTSDGTIRWTGDAVAKLVAAEDLLHPRLRIISDERLSGAPRDAVQARLDLWLKTHIEKLLGPLFDLQKAEDITGIARGIAFQLIEALGVLERARIVAEMKDLDQPSRASLRKYGVRFGAYHIYVPALLKPAARALASLLWAQKQDVDLSALSGAQHLAGSGRTSFPVDKLLDRDAYRVLGYRQCGERAVRVDILERLADLIRPALSWREGSLGTKPAGAFDGRGFVVTQAMTSLTGSAGEDFASILRALGYRMERRPAPPPKPAVVEAAAAEPASTEVAAETAGEATPSEATPSEAAPTETTPSETMSSEASLEGAAAIAEVAAKEAPAVVESGDVAEPASDVPQISEEVEAAPSATLLPEIALSPATEAEAPIAIEAQSDPTASIETPAPDAPLETPAETAGLSDAPAAEAAVAAAPETVAVPEMVEVWRPGGRSEERRPRHDRNRHRHQNSPQQGAEPAVAAAGEAGEGAKRERHRGGRRNRHNDFRKPNTDAPVEAVAVVAAPDGAAVGESGQPSHQEPRREPNRHQDRGRPSRERFQGKDRESGEAKSDRPKSDRPKGKFEGQIRGGRDRDNGGRDKGGRDKRDSGPSHRQFATSAPPRERERPIDPNSPFAKLAALREQLTANRKDR